MACACGSLLETWMRSRGWSVVSCRDARNGSEPPSVGSAGILLTPSVDHLFDRGFIGFEDSGRLVISPVAHKPSMQKMGVETEKPVTVGDFTSGQKKFLDFHRNSVLFMAVR